MTDDKVHWNRAAAGKPRWGCLNTQVTFRVIFNEIPSLMDRAVLINRASTYGSAFYMFCKISDATEMCLAPPGPASLLKRSVRGLTPLLAHALFYNV